MAGTRHRLVGWLTKVPRPHMAYQDRSTDTQDVAVHQHRFVDRNSVHIRAIATPQIANRQPPAFQAKQRVLSRYLLVVENPGENTAMVAPDDVLTGNESPMHPHEVGIRMMHHREHHEVVALFAAG